MSNAPNAYILYLTKRVQVIENDSYLERMQPLPQRVCFPMNLSISAIRRVKILHSKIIWHLLEKRAKLPSKRSLFKASKLRLSP